MIRDLAAILWMALGCWVVMATGCDALPELPPGPFQEARRRRQAEQPRWVAKRARAHLQAALGLIRQERWHEAIGHAEAAIEDDPSLAEAHALCALAQVQIGQLAEPTEHLVRAVDLKPDQAEWQYELGLLLLQQGLYERALPHLQQAAALAPSDRDFAVALAAGYRAVGRPHEADGVLQRAGQTPPRSPRDPVISQNQRQGAVR